MFSSVKRCFFFTFCGTIFLCSITFECSNLARLSVINCRPAIDYWFLMIIHSFAALTRELSTEINSIWYPVVSHYNEYENPSFFVSYRHTRLIHLTHCALSMWTKIIKLANFVLHRNSCSGSLFFLPNIVTLYILHIPQLLQTAT